jgi:hypothetical protein
MDEFWYREHLHHALSVWGIKHGPIKIPLKKKEVDKTMEWAKEYLEGTGGHSGGYHYGLSFDGNEYHLWVITETSHLRTGFSQSYILYEMVLE